MTYCLAIAVEEGLVFASDSRTNAGLDQISSHSKMHTFGINGQRQIVLLSSGNLAITQSVISTLRRDIESGADINLNTVDDIADAADYVGQISLAAQSRFREADGCSYEVSFILGGQINSYKPRIMLIYPQGNHITTSNETRYLQIGESKYGKPVLDRFIHLDTALDHAARCAVVSMDSTMRANVTVGLPIEMILYQRDSLQINRRLLLTEDSAYLRDLRQSWDQKLHQAFSELPSIDWAEAHPEHAESSPAITSKTTAKVNQIQG